MYVLAFCCQCRTQGDVWGHFRDGNGVRHTFKCLAQKPREVSVRVMSQIFSRHLLHHRQIRHHAVESGNSVISSWTEEEIFECPSGDILEFRRSLRTLVMMREIRAPHARTRHRRQQQRLRSKAEGIEGRVADHCFIASSTWKSHITPRAIPFATGDGLIEELDERHSDNSDK